MTDARLVEEFEGLEVCCLHDPQWQPADVTEIIRWVEDSPEGYGSTDQQIIVKLTSGFGLLTSWSDTTGHGCRCDTQTVKADTLYELLRHVEAGELTAMLRTVTP